MFPVWSCLTLERSPRSRGRGRRERERLRRQWRGSWYISITARVLSLRGHLYDSLHRIELWLNQIIHTTPQRTHWPTHIPTLIYMKKTLTTESTVNSARIHLATGLYKHTTLLSSSQSGEYKSPVIINLLNIRNWFSFQFPNSSESNNNEPWTLTPHPLPRRKSFDVLQLFITIVLLPVSSYLLVHLLRGSSAPRPLEAPHCTSCLSL